MRWEWGEAQPVSNVSRTVSTIAKNRSLMPLPHIVLKCRVIVDAPSRELGLDKGACNYSFIPPHPADQMLTCGREVAASPHGRNTVSLHRARLHAAKRCGVGVTTGRSAPRAG